MNWSCRFERHDMIRTLGKKYNQLKIKSALNKNRAKKTSRDVTFLQGRRFLCLLLSAIGDAIMAQPAWTMLKASIPEATIDLVCWPHLSRLFRADPAVNSLLIFEHPRGKLWHNRDVLRLEKIWKNASYDFVLDFAQLPLTSVACALQSSPYSVGLQKTAESSDQGMSLSIAYDLPIPYSESDPIRDVMLQMVKPWTSAPMKRPNPRLYVTNDKKEAMIRWLREKGISSKEKFIILAPGAKWPPRRWPLLHWRLLIEKLNHALPYPVIVLGGLEDTALIHSITGEKSDPSVARLVSNDTATSAAIMKMAALCVCNDSGAMHIAAAVGTPSIALFGPGHPHKTAPPEEDGAHILYADTFCSPCTQYYARDRCRRGINFCMHALTPERVYREIEKLI
jgi:heptosyltransferase II